MNKKKRLTFCRAQSLLLQKNKCFSFVGGKRIISEFTGELYKTFCITRSFRTGVVRFGGLR